jgi:hypothetical protein
MASPVDEPRCRACGARRLVAESPTGSAVTGPAAAEAWAASRAVTRADDAAGGRPRSGLRPSTVPVGPWAVAAWRSLHVLVLVALAVAAVAAARFVLVVAADDPVVLVAEDWWETLDGVAGVLAVGLFATAAVGVVLVTAWAAVAGRNLSQLSLDVWAWTRSTERAVGRLVLAGAAVGVWRWAANGPGTADRAVDLVAATAAAAACAALAAAVQRLLVVVTTAELEREEWLLRLEAAATPRPRGRGAVTGSQNVG